MAAPLPTGSQMQVMPMAPQSRSRGFVEVDLGGSMARGMDIAEKFSRLGSLSDQLDLEEAQRKAAKVKAEATRMEAELIKANRDLFQSLIVNEEMSSMNFLTVVHDSPLKAEKASARNAMPGMILHKQHASFLIDSNTKHDTMNV